MELQQDQTTQQMPPLRPKTWLVESILATIFCCLPFGIAGIVNATKVDSLYAQGLYDQSIQASANAKKWTMVALIIGIVWIVIYIILMVAGVFAGLSGLGGSSTY